MKKLDVQRCHKFPPSDKYVGVDINVPEIGDKVKAYYKFRGSNHHPRTVKTNELTGDCSIIRGVDNNWYITSKALWNKLTLPIPEGTDAMITLKVIARNSGADIPEGWEWTVSPNNYELRLIGHAESPCPVMGIMDLKINGTRMKKG
jgi:hypothetical protein